MKRRGSADQYRLRHTLRWRLTLFVFGVMLISGFLTACVYVAILSLFGKTRVVLAITVNPIFLCLTLFCSCALIGAVLASFLGRYYLRPLKQVIRATKEIKKGNFKVRLEKGGNPQAEMNDLIDNFNEMAKELDGIELFRNDFINNFSHEFKTPIVSIRGFAKELEMDGLSPAERQEYAHIIAEEADRLAHLSANVLELSKLENQQIVTDREAFYLDEQLRQCILMQESAWTAKSIEMIPELEEIRYFGSEEILAHVWNNLLANAIKFTPDGGEIRVQAFCTAQEVTVRICDTGIGMSEEVRARVFEKFYQGETSHAHKGYGIGLTLAQRAAVLSGGSIEVESTLGEGSTFTVTLPTVECP